VLLLNRPDAHGHGESDRPGEADIIVAKNRPGQPRRGGLPGSLLPVHAPWRVDAEPPGATAGEFY
jgi:replicative DNA helicase